MTGADIVAALMIADTPIAALVASGNIKLAQLPDGVALPALLARTVSIVDRQRLTRGGKRRRTDRVSVTVRAASYRSQVAIIAQVRTLFDTLVTDVTGAGRVSILLAGTGPDLAGPANSFEQTQDVRVSFDEPA